MSEDASGNGTRESSSKEGPEPGPDKNTFLEWIGKAANCVKFAWSNRNQQHATLLEASP